MDTLERAQYLRKLCRCHYKLSMGMMREKGITQGQPPILEYLSTHDGCIQNDLSRSCRLEPATVTSILSTMERDALIERRASPEDRRVWRIFLTEVGREASETVRTTSADIGDICFAGFSEEESALMTDFISRMNANIREVLCADDKTKKE